MGKYLDMLKAPVTSENEIAAPPAAPEAEPATEAMRTPKPGRRKAADAVAAADGDPPPTNHGRQRAVIDPVPAILSLALVQVALALFQLSHSNGIGLAIRNGRLTILSYGRLWRSLLQAIQQNATGIARLVVPINGGFGLSDGIVDVIGDVRSTPPGPVEIVQALPPPIPAWLRGPHEDDDIKQSWIEGALKAAGHHKIGDDPGWGAEQLAGGPRKVDGDP